MIKRVVAMSLGALALSLSAAGEPVASRGGLYRLTIESHLVPLAINRIHDWNLVVTMPDGSPVNDAAIRVDGGMPAHNHGLPTAPKVRKDDGDGHYLLEGMRFHMHGDWRIEITIDAPTGRDVVELNLQL